MYEPKTLTQVKTDLLRCVLDQSHPMEMTREVDVRRASNRLQSLGSDHWCQVWSETARSYEERGREEEKMGNYEKAKNSFMLAYNYYRMARFPVPNTPAKKAAYQASVKNYVKASCYFDPPLERIVIPFEGRKGEGKEIRANLRKPKGIDRPPVLINHAGVDVFKEEQCLIEPAFLDLLLYPWIWQGQGNRPFWDRWMRSVFMTPLLPIFKTGVISMGLGLGYWA
jgi:esterase FrsA